MSGRRILAISRRIAEGFRRDPRSLALLFVVPLAVLILLGWVIRGEQFGTTRMAVVSAAGPAGAVVARAIEKAATEGGLTVVQAPDEASARNEIASGNLDLALILPADLGTVTVITEGVNPTEDVGRIGEAQRALVVAIQALEPEAARMPTLQRATVFGSPDADTLDTFGPIFVGLFAYLFVYILTGISFLRERIGSTLERLLATPVTRAEIVTGYTLGFAFFATIQVIVVVTFALMNVEIPAIGPIPSFAIGLGIPIAGSPALAFLVALILAVGAVSLGIFLSTYARTELQVLQFIPLAIVPQIFLSGVFWPVDTLPDLLQPVARVLPLTYAVEGLREVMIKGADLSSATLQVDLLVLLGIAALFVVLAAGTIRREVA